MIGTRKPNPSILEEPSTSEFTPRAKQVGQKTAHCRLRGRDESINRRVSRASWRWRTWLPPNRKGAIHAQFIPSKISTGSIVVENAADFAT